MEIQKLLKLYARHPQVRALCRVLAGERKRHVVLSGLQGSAAAMVFAAIDASVAGDASPATCLFILDDQDEAGYFYHDLTQIMGEERVLFFPSSFRRAVKFGQRDAANEILRTEVMARLSTQPECRHEGISSASLPPGDCDASSSVSQSGEDWGARGKSSFIVTYPEALAERVISRQKLNERTLEIRVGEQVDIPFVEQTLLAFGFSRTDYVYEPGQFAVRGSLIDVYSFSNELPFRIDFFGDEVDSIRTFEVDSQLSHGKRDAITLVPELSGENSGLIPLAELLPEDTVVVSNDLTFVTQRIGQIWEEGFSKQAELSLTSAPALDKKKVLIDAQTFESGFSVFRSIELSPSLTHTSASAIGRGRETVINYSTSAQPIFHKNFELLGQTLTDYLANGYKLYILADSAKQTERLKEIFESQYPIPFTPVTKTLHAGFVDNDLKMCVFTDHQIFDRFHKYNLRSERARSGKVALSLKELREFEIGDYVVHVDHGIGRFGGLVMVPQNTNPAGGSKEVTMQEMIKITYDHDDVVYVSIHALHKVSKYKGKEGEPPRISRLGTGAWERMKERTKSKIKDIARDLIRLYSRRREEQGFKFSPDSYLQHELEASFLYEDTPDQLKATNDVKADMERARPMDRLVCGDVGFGKTEVAVRAAFKAAADGKQTAVLVPTTVLAFQHFHTFSDRLRDLPVRVDYLTRARTPKQTKELLADLEAGKIDILIGTHKLIGKSIKFKDLGLLIIDEEQKFGVATKERLRQMKVNVDTLTLTATPIPRTLQFSLMGARDLSVIQTPPPNRYPIQTEVHTFSPEIIAEAIDFEMSRGGQLFIVNNRIAGLPELEQLVHKYVPDARVAVGHGQMHSEELERVMMDFASYDYDVLISTTIIESGLDIPNANTIIICGAHNFGLSDLHQMRGRVGRSNKKAFCYLLAPPLAALPQESRRRLQAIENFADLGSGIHIAMQDLDIRGAGNLLGAEQSGFIADLGYETYQKILSEAVKELKNDEFKELYADQVASGEVTSGDAFVDECQLESDMPMSFPDSFVPGSAERMLLYRELDGLETEEAVEAFRRRLTDRFGPIPETAQELIRVVCLRRLGKYFGAERIMLKNSRMRLYFVKDDDSPFFQSHAFGQCISYFSLHPAYCQLDEVKGRRSMLIRGINSVKEACALLEEMQNIKE
ncbi:MAG: transcription-repair coupling factor [Bacteroidaceae bacterium]|nr:transcription-repair coupling factor [Bacteroidaceae bacterium]